MVIAQIETSQLKDNAGLLLCRITTNEGIQGCGETWCIPSAAAAVIHDWMAPRLLNRDPLETEGHWRFLYERAANFGARGAELRALSALDLALWDIKGQSCGQPVWQLLGGRTQERVRIYNSIGYGKTPLRKPGGSWPGYGLMGDPGPWNDYWKVVHTPAEFAHEMVELGISAVKLWTMDFAAHKPNGSIYVSPSDIREGLRPFYAIREAVGDRLELILDGHGFFQLPVALRIADALREAAPLCLEDVIRPDCIDTIQVYRRRSGLPIAVSEMFIGMEDYRLLLEKRAADYVMIDPTWVGGISQTVKIVDLAQAYNIPVMMHDCTGPFTLLAGLHVATARANVAWQETVRLNMQERYHEWVDAVPEISEGMIQLSERSGIGAAWHDSLFQPPHTVRLSSI